MKQRIDEILVQRAIIDTRSKAKSLIMAGYVFVNDKKVLKAGELFDSSLDLEIFIKEKDPYVSRAAHKLIKAIDKFSINIRDKVCLDGGSSTGGFTQVMLEYGAKKVYAIDVGYGQMHYSLRNHPDIVLMERFNLRNLSRDDISQDIEFFTLDVSFISIKLVIEKILEVSSEDVEAVILIKPQFEARREDVGKKGIISDRQVHFRVLVEITNYLKSIGLKIENIDYSPIKGAKGNIEFICHISRKNSVDRELDIEKVVIEAHRELLC